MAKNKKSYTLDELLAIVDDIYPDGLVGLYYRAPHKNHGDTLAKFIVAELRETFDATACAKEQRQEVLRVLQNAVMELQRIMAAINGKASRTNR